jgi:hypothetical protein
VGVVVCVCGGGGVGSVGAGEGVVWGQCGCGVVALRLMRLGS